MFELPVTETPAASAAYERYCALGPARSLRKLARILEDESRAETDFNNALTGASKEPRKAENIFRQLSVWSSAHTWQERVKVYDREKAQEAAAEREEKIKQLNEKHVQLARAQTLRAVQEIQHLASIHKLTGQAAVTLFKYAVDLERVAMGVPTEVSQTATSTTPADLQDEPHDLARLIRDDPEATRLICLLFDRVSLGPSGRRGTFGLEYFLAQRTDQPLAELGSSLNGDPGEPGDLENGGPPLDNELPADGT